MTWTHELFWHVEIRVCRLAFYLARLKSSLGLKEPLLTGNGLGRFENPRLRSVAYTGLGHPSWLLTTYNHMFG